MTLVILAAGMGSRFGGLKQIEPIGANKEFIIDYSVYDAIKAGFDKVVFIIKRENYDIFRETIGKRIENKIRVDYVFQENDDLPFGFSNPKDRIKPWGTAHAILSCRDVVKENFAMINADDFYGRESYEIISQFLKENKDDNLYAMVGYKVINTLALSGSVKRGICTQKGDYLESIIECNVIKNGNIVASPLDGSTPFIVNNDSLVSMNMFGFTPKILEYLEKGFKKFLKENENNLSNCEYLIPTAVFEQIKNGDVRVKVLTTSSKWLGITYKEDKDSVKEEIEKLQREGIYPQNLWN